MISWLGDWLRGEHAFQTGLGCAPVPLCVWHRGVCLDPGPPRWQSPGLAALLNGSAPVRSPWEIAAALPPAEAEAFRGAFARLRVSGTPFRIPGTRLMVSGRRWRRLDVLSVEDNSALTAARTEAEAARKALAGVQAELQQMERLTNALPLPLWRCDARNRLAWCNEAYTQAVATEGQRSQVLAEGRELPGGAALVRAALTASGSRQERRHVVIARERRLLEISAVALSTPETLPEQRAVAGFALDRTREEELQAELDRHLRAHAAMLEHMGTAIAIYSGDLRLIFYNQAYVQLWRLEERWLAGRPTFAEVLEELRTRRRLPETADFHQYKKEMLALFRTLTEPREDLLHLPDGSTLRMLVAPHALGGLVFVLEDVTPALALQSSYNTLMAVQRETLDNLAEGAAVFGGDGRLRLSNPAFAQMWHLTQDDLADAPHLGTLLDRMRPQLDAGGNWAVLRQRILDAVLDREPHTGRFTSTNGTVLNFTYVPLPDGAVLTAFLDITDSVRVEQALRARNAALAEADRLRTDFLANVSYHLRQPLNAIMGFAEILANQYYGALNPRQLEFSQNVMASGEQLLSMIDDILDLATIEAGYISLDQRPVAVAALFNAVQSLAQEWTVTKGLRLETLCPAGTGTIVADEKRLKQALFNLVSHASRATAPGGIIRLSAERAADTLTLTVAVTGTPAENQPPPEALDLRLSLVRSFVELHGGSVHIDDTPFAGATVTCHMPAGSSLSA